MLRNSVHKHAESMVAFDSGTVVSISETVLTPKPHLSISYSGTDLGWTAPLQLAEVLRQSVIASVHLLGSTPVGSAFVMERMVLKVDTSVRGTQDGRVELRTRENGTHKGVGGSSRIVTSVDFRRSTHRFASGLGHLRVVPKASYERLRGAGARASNLDLPQRGGAAVTLSPVRPGLSWAVKFNPRDSFFFDHPVDHVPGMLLFEAARMASSESIPEGLALAEFDGRFCRFIELQEEIVVELARPAGSAVAEFRVSGDGRLAAFGSLTYASARS